VTRLALLDTSARPDTPEQTARRRGLIELAEKGSFKGVTPRLLPLLIHESRLDDEALTGVVLGMAERIGKDAFLRQQRAIMGRPDSRPTLVSIRCPTLVICGRQDVLAPLDCAMEIAAGITDARLVVAEDCGHLSPLERPETVNQAMAAWLA
jgi:pimeloyl-ACP methyl ester carboxylesterase